MATLFNNTEITNAFFNGTELDKIYFNGVLVFEKGGKYKRRIMVGDDLRNKIITTAPHTNTVYQFLRSYIDSNPDTFYLSFITTENEMLDPNYEKGSYCAIQTYDENGIYVPYDFNRGASPTVFLDGTSESDIIINNNVEIPFVEEDLTIVTETIDNNPVYRWLYIEDENIRPFEIGDVIIPGTKVYFNFPDSFTNEINNYPNGTIIINTNSETDFGKIKKSDYSGPLSSSINILAPTQPFYDIILIDEGVEGIFEWDSTDIYPFKNKSVYTFTKNDMATVTNVLEELKEHILVDTRTLGTTGYKRRIMAGDNLRNKNIFLENYPENLYDLMYQDGMDGSTTLIDINNEYTIHQNISVEGVYPNYTVLYGYIDTWPLAADEMNTEIYFFDKRETPTTYEIYSPILVKNDIDYLVTKCYNRVGYRVLYIEDPNIRPVQVGDKIVEGTKFYFNFPDDFNKVLSTASNTGEFIKTKEKNPDYDTLYLKIESSSYEVCFQSNYGTINDIYWYRDGQLDTNISTFTASTSNILDFGYNYATVSFIDENNIAYPYVLVDITTLG